MIRSNNGLTFIVVSAKMIHAFQEINHSSSKYLEEHGGEWIYWKKNPPPFVSNIGGNLVTTNLKC